MATDVAVETTMVRTSSLTSPHFTITITIPIPHPPILN